MASQIEKLRRVDEVEEEEGLVQVGEIRQACTNPLLIDTILSNMFELCDFEQLAQLRSVSKQWYNRSLPAWLNKAPTLRLSLNPNGNPERGDYYHPGDIHMTMNDFLLLVHNEFRSYGPYEFFGVRQYKKFELDSDSLEDEPAQEYYLQQFIRIYGEFVTELKLLEVEIPDLESFRTITLSTRTPNLIKLSANLELTRDDLQHGAYYERMLGEEQHRKLTSLQISPVSYEGDDFSALPEAGWVQLFKRYPKLKALSLGWTTEDSRRLRYRDDGVLEERTDRLLHSLLPLFRNAQLALESLGLRFGEDGPAQRQTITGILASQAPTLKRLSLHRVDPLDENFQLPELPFVQYLELYGMPFPNLSSLRRFPSLKSLSFNNPISDETRVYDPFPKMLRDSSKKQGLIIIPSLSKLHFDYGRVAKLVENPLGPDDVVTLAGHFPNLKDLQLWLTNGSLGAVVRSWPNLQQLTIIGNGVDKKGIAGIVSDLPRMQDLKSLVMRHYNRKYARGIGPTALTPKSLMKFLKLPALERLEITLHEKLSVKADILEQMEDNFKTFKLTRARIWTRRKELTKPDSDSEEDDIQLQRQQ